MAEIKAAAPAAGKQVKCRVVSNYGGKPAGAMIEVSEKEYQRMTAIDAEGVRSFPVLISAADEEAQVKASQVEREEQQKRLAESGDHGAGWGEMERQSLAVVRGRYRAAREEEERAAKQVA